MNTFIGPREKFITALGLSTSISDEELLAIVEDKFPGKTVVKEYYDGELFYCLSKDEEVDSLNEKPFSRFCLGFLYKSGNIIENIQKSNRTIEQYVETLMQLMGDLEKGSAQSSAANESIIKLTEEIERLIDGNTSTRLTVQRVMNDKRLERLSIGDELMRDKMFGDVCNDYMGVVAKTNKTTPRIKNRELCDLFEISERKFSESRNSTDISNMVNPLHFAALCFMADINPVVAIKLSLTTKNLMPLFVQKSRPFESALVICLIEHERSNCLQENWTELPENRKRLARKRMYHQFIILTCACYATMGNALPKFLSSNDLWKTAYDIAIDYIEKKDK